MKSSKNIYKVVMTGGGTAGHITPLIAVAKELYAKNPDIKITYIGQRGDKNESVIVNSNLPIEIRRIFAGKYRRYPSQSKIQKIFYFKRHILNIRDVFYAVLGLMQAIKLIASLKPDAVFMKGGYVGVPVGLASGLLKKRLITHDSDTVPGLANRIVSRFVDTHAVATDAEYPYPKAKTVVVGIPIREEYYEYSKAGGRLRAKRELGFDKNGRILFIGGSTQGAKKIDDTVEEIIPGLLNKFPDLHIIQVFGRLNTDSINNRYTSLSDDMQSRLHLHEFLHDNYRYMAASDVLIGRAGATFLAEAGILSSACIIIPAPHLAGSHQLENGLALSSKKAAIVINEKDLNKDMLAHSIEDLLNDDKKRLALGQLINSIQHRDSAKLLADIILKNKDSD